MIVRNTSTRPIQLRDVSGNLYNVPALGDLTISDTLWADNTFRAWVRTRIRDLVVATSTAGDSVSNAPSTSAQNTIQATSTTPVPLTVKLFTASTQNLQEWRNAANTILTSIDSTGKLSVGSTGIVLTGSTGQFLQRSAAASSTAVMAFRVTGDGNDRASWTADGTLLFGPGSTAGDTTIGRAPTGGILSTATITLSGATGDVNQRTFSPTINGAFTLSRLNYLTMTQPAGAATITDAAVVRFDAAAGTHKAVDSGTTKTTPGTVNAWVKVNVNGTVHYLPAYTSKTT